ncbi:MAG: hypothetical protein R3310_17610, partial [Candidatus Competibacteraceae bacterium]|nr:hypothetical protein [Candidatus Competibacteraceae bacterium]
MSSVMGQYPPQDGQPSAAVGNRASQDERIYHDPGPWRRLSEAKDLQGFAVGWLDLQCRLIPGVVRGLLVLSEPEEEHLVPLAWWPGGEEGSPGLMAVAELAMAERRGVVRQHKSSRRQDQALPAHDLAYPLLLDGQPAGMVAVEVTGREPSSLRVVMRQLLWGMGWLEARIRRPVQRPAMPAAPQPVAVLGLVAACLEQERFQASATALVTELAVLLGCERVSLGFRPHR